MYTKPIAVFLLLATFSITRFSVGQELPLIANFANSTYRAHNQNWDISQGADNIMYAANSDGLLE